MNIQTQIQKLSKLGYAALAEHHDWLFKTVHPSLGATFAFSRRVPEGVLVLPEGNNAFMAGAVPGPDRIL